MGLLEFCSPLGVTRIEGWLTVHRLVCSELTASVRGCVWVKVRVRVRVGLAVPESLVFLIGPQAKRLLPKRGRGRDENKQIRKRET